MDRGLVDRAFAGEMVEDQAVLRVEIEHAHALMRQLPHVDGEVIHQRLPTAEDGAVLHRPTGHPARRQRHAAQRCRIRFAHALDLHQRSRIGVQDGAERSELRDQPLGDRFGVALSHPGEKEEFEQLVIGQRFGAALQQAFAQSCAVTGAGVASGGSALFRRVGSGTRGRILRQAVLHLPQRHVAASSRVKPHCL